jgi:hypothetical protein
VAALQGAITLTWMLYRLYLSQLLAGFGFAGFDRGITILEDSLAITIEPFAGWLSDKQRHAFLLAGVCVVAGDRLK